MCSCTQGMAPQGGNKIKKFDSRHVTPGIFAGMESEVREVADEDPDVVIKKEKHDEQDGKLDDDDISQAVRSLTHTLRLNSIICRCRRYRQVGRRTRHTARIQAPRSGTSACNCIYRCCSCAIWRPDTPQTS